MPPRPSLSSRRRFIHVGGGLVAGSGLVAARSPAAHARLPAGGGDRIRVGLVGCGGRGTGAALQTLAADPGAEIVALGDLFADRVSVAADAVARASARRHRGVAGAPVRVVGEDACAGVIAAGVDLILLATPPVRRPAELEAAVAAGCHVYCEAPVAVDAAGCSRSAQALAEARGRGLVVVSGLAFRRDPGTAAVIERIHAGAIGAPRSLIVVAPSGLPWRVPCAAGMTAAEWRQRNWISFADLGGGPLVERQVHAIDKALWALGDAVPAWATGRVRPGHRDRWSIGDVTDRFAVRYHFASGAMLHLHCRRDGTGDAIPHETVHGHHGVADLLTGVVVDSHRHDGGPPGADPTAGPKTSDGTRYQAGMDRLLAAIRSGTAVDDGPGLVRATAVAILGREAARSGGRVDFADLGLPYAGTNRLFDTAVTIGQAVKTA